jgi:hypothetical protein
MKAGGQVALLACLLMPLQVFACRCAERTLSEYFAEADAVFFGRLQDSEALDNDRQLRFELLGSALQLPDTFAGSMAVSLLTADNTASCGLPPEIDAVYVVFARLTPDKQLRTDTCNGTRIQLSAKNPEPQGFKDVPARFVVQQLNGLAGADLLRQVAANHPSQTDPDNDKRLGLLDLKSLAHGGNVAVMALPSRDATVLALIEDYASLDNAEYDYEMPAAIVYTVSDHWYRVKLGDGRFGWIEKAVAGTFFPYADIVINRLGYLTPAWSGFVWPEAGAGLPIRTQPKASGETPVNVIESQNIGGSLWFRVKILRNNGCEGEEPRQAAGGWIPGYGADGTHNVWFYSRGC